jgi:hypothetical protein
MRCRAWTRRSRYDETPLTCLLTRQRAGGGGPGGGSVDREGQEVTVHPVGSHLGARRARASARGTGAGLAFGPLAGGLFGDGLGGGRRVGGRRRGGVGGVAAQRVAQVLDGLPEGGALPLEGRAAQVALAAAGASGQPPPQGTTNRAPPAAAAGRVRLQRADAGGDLGGPERDLIDPLPRERAASFGEPRSHRPWCVGRMALERFTNPCDIHNA